MSVRTIMLALAFVLGASSPVFSQTTQSDSARKSDSAAISNDPMKNNAAGKEEDDKIVKSNSGIVAAPYIKYAPETGLALGASALYYFRIFNDDNPNIVYRPSSLSGGATYSTKNQLSTGMDYTLYLFNDKIYVFGGFDYKRIPFDFYGVGNGNPASPTDSYTPLWVGGDCLVTYNILRTEQGEGLSAGICAEDRHDNILSSDSGGPLQTANVPGAKGGVSAGLGVIVTYDTRDNVFSSHTGNFVDFRVARYSAALGGSFNFTRVTLDTRTFYPVTETNTFAVQGLLTLATDGEPFYTMAALGGDNNMRGYAENRYRSNDMAVLQAEYRFPVWRRFGLCGFAGIGEVGQTANDFTYYGIKFSAGAGIRFTVSQAERLTVRLDFGVGNNSNELYLQVMEAF